MDLCQANFRSCHFSERIDARRQDFYFFTQFFLNNWQGMSWTTLLDADLGYRYILNGIRLDLDLDKSCCIRKCLQSFS